MGGAPWRCLAVVCTLAIGGCGSSSAPAPSAPPESPQAPPKPPPGWSTEISNNIGYGINVPPGWKITEHNDATLIRSPDHLVAVSITSDRTEDALSIPLDSYARGALKAIPGFRGGLEAESPKPLAGTPYDAIELDAHGIASSTGVTEQVTLVVMRRDEAVSFVAAIALNSDQPAAVRERATALRMVRTLRDQPVAPPVPPE